MEIDLPGGGAEAGATARSRFGAALIPCRRIGEERYGKNMVDMFLSISVEYI
jgi:hypothetical protein